jgi:RNA polymerase sigma-70 factor (ECF subfamily)
VAAQASEPRASREERLAPEAEALLDPEREALMADAIGPASLVVLDTLTPAERLAFELHDLCDVPFEEIAPSVGRSPIATRQLASRACRRARGQRAVGDAFLAASRSGDFEALLALLDRDVVVRADDAGLPLGVWSGICGAQAVARRFAGVSGARPARRDEAVGAAWAPGGQPRLAFVFTSTHDKIAAIDLVADAEHRRRLDPGHLDG